MQPGNRLAVFAALLLLTATALVAAERVAGLVRVLPDKLRYHPLEAGTVAVTVHNFTATELPVSLQLRLIREIDRTRVLPAVEVTLPANAERTVALPFTADQGRYGCEARVSLLQGATVLDTKSDCFAVHENLWPVAIGGDFHISSSSGYPWQNTQSAQNDIKHARANYLNWWEKDFWAPDDWGDLTPKSDTWRSGEGGRLEIKQTIKEFIGLAKANGIASITYGKSTGCGPAGWELVRRHPDWFKQNTLGQPIGIYNTAYFPLNRWDKYPGNAGGLSQWFYVYPSLNALPVVDWGIDQLIASAQEYGWDGVRFDGDFTWVGSDEVAARNQRRMKERIAAKCPDFVFGYNEGYGPPDSDPATWSHGLRESLAGGGHWMNEGIGFGGGKWGYSTTGHYLTYEDYWRRVNHEADLIRQVGASYHFIYGIQNDIRGYYKFLLGTQAGVHPIYGDSARVPGCANWGRFLTRWSAFCWDVNLRNRPDADAEIAAAVPLWHAVKARVVDANTKTTIVHLLVPPSVPAIDTDGVQIGAPAPPATLRVRIPATEKIVRATVIAPEHPDTALAIPCTRDGNWVKVTTPEVTSWTMVVIESTGAFTLPTYPQYTEPPNAEQVNAAMAANVMRLSNDPLKAAKKDENANSKRSLSVAGLYLAGGTPEKDAAASDGRSLRLDTNDNGVIVTHAIFGGLPLGCYRATVRAKLKAANDEAGNPAKCRFGLYIPLRGTTYVALRGVDLFVREWKRSDFTTIGQYEEFSGEFDFLGDSSQINLLLRKDGSGTVNVDTISLEKVAAYSDADVVAKVEELRAKAGKAAAETANIVQVSDLPIGKPGAGRNILVVNGLYADLYHLPEACARLGKVIDDATPPTTTEKANEQADPPAANAGEVRVQNVTLNVEEERCTLAGYPGTLAGLSRYDTVVLINVDASWLPLQQRIAMRDFVKAGGGLLVLGGNYSLGQGQFAGTFLEDILPITVAEAKDVQPAAKPLPLSKPANSLADSLPGEMWKAPGYLYWRHVVKPKPGAKVELLAGTEPVLFSAAAGKGRVAVFTGTVLGEATGHEQPFWQWDGWIGMMGNTLGWLGRR